MKYTVWQIQYSEKDIETINNGGFNPRYESRMAMTMDFKDNRIGSIADDAIMAGHYTHVADITADTPEHCFQIGNIGPESNIMRITRMSSLSVGDVIVDSDGQCLVVANFGFIAFSYKPEMSAANLTYHFEMGEAV